jgi:hypothetical protein
LYGFVQDQAKDGIRHTRTTLDNRLGELKLSRADLRATLHVALERGHLLELALPEGERRDARKNFLSPAVQP